MRIGEHTGWYLKQLIGTPFVCFGLMMSLVSLLTAGTTGKISGRIIDGSTEEALAYCNVYIEGTTLGAITNPDGLYSILNVPPGSYTVTATYMGYNPFSYTKAQVSIDLTTTLNFELSKTVLELGEVVVVETTRPLITKDLTASTAIVTADEIASLPVTEFLELLELQAGFVGGHVRGGRTGEVVYAIDGVPVTDVYDGSTVIDVNPNSIQELQFVSGAFNAEYGRALSGYVNVVTKEPGNKFIIGITSYTGDHVSSHTDIFRSIDQIDPISIKNLDGYVSFPIFRNTLSFYGNARYIYFGGWQNGKREYMPWDITTSKGPSEPLETRYVIQKTGDGRIVPMNWNEKIYAQGKLTFKPFSASALRYNFIIDRVHYQDYEHSYSLNPDGNLGKFREAYTNILGLTQLLSTSTFFQINLAHFNKEYMHHVYENSSDSRYTHYALLNQQPQEMPSFKTGGTINQQFNRTTRSVTLKFDFTSQLNQIHQAKFGFDITKHTLTFRDINLLQEEGLSDPAITGEPFAAVRVPDPYDPNENLVIDQYERSPLESSIYLQDKIELTDLIINVGVRLDFFRTDGKILADPSDPDIYRPRRDENINKDINERRSYWYNDTTPKYQVSPRIGFAFPITDRGVVHFSYGHFFQIPNFKLLYQNPEYKFGPGTGNLGIAGNPDLNPESTISGEVGVQQALMDNFSIDLTGYFRDIRYLAGTRADEIVLFGGAGKYSQIVNSDFGFVRGVVLSLNKRLSNNWSANINYTLQTAKGNASDPAATRNQMVGGQEAEIQLVRLDFDQTHTANVTFSYVSQKNWGFSLIGQYGSGFPYTPTQSMEFSKLLTNSETRPSTFDVDLRTYKDFVIGNLEIKLFTRVYNLFDTRNQLDVYNDSGTADFTLVEYLRKQQDLPELINSLNRYYRIPTFYSEPRRIELGLSVQY